mgnify:FL=1
MQINVIGAGLAGCEAAYKIANNGYKVNLYDMKPSKFSPAHKNKNFAELVCSNSLKAKRIESAAGLLKEEMRLLNSLLIECALKCEVPAGGALAVDREKFSELVTKKIRDNKNINVIELEVEDIPTDDLNIIATGPLTADKLAEKIKILCKKSLSFYDAAAPIVTFESIDMENAFFASRYDKGEDQSYINCPMNKAEYENFYEALISAQRAPLHHFEDSNVKVYEGCMPVEVMAKRGLDTLRFGPLKPVGLRDPKTGHRPWAVVQLRKENIKGSLYNMVGFQTNLKFFEQKRVFGMIPALKNADFIRYGVMHRNTFIDSPRVLNSDFSLSECPNIFFAGQITGVEGYMESAASGIMAGINVVKKLRGKESLTLPKETMIGSLCNYISDKWVKDFQPMGANFGILPPIEPHIRDKKERYSAFAKRSIELVSNIIKDLNIE